MLMAVALSLLLGAYNGLVAGPIERYATAEVCLLAGLVVLLPWGWRPQLAVSLAALGSVRLATADPPTAEAVAYSILAVVTGGTTSVCGAFFLDRYRRDAFVRAALETEETEIAAAQTRPADATNLIRVSSTQQAAASGSADLLRTLIALAIVVSAICVLRWLLKRMSSRVPAGAGWQVTEQPLADGYIKLTIQVTGGAA